MSLWQSEADMKAFAKSGAHLEAMKSSARIAKEIRSVTIDAEELPSWEEAKELLKTGRVMRF
jgi:hypothetical protein